MWPLSGPTGSVTVDQNVSRTGRFLAPFSGITNSFFRRSWKGAAVISLASRERVLDVANTTPERTRAVIIDECTYTHDTFPPTPWNAMQLKDRKEDCDNVSESSGDSWNLQF